MKTSCFAVAALAALVPFPAAQIANAQASPAAAPAPTGDPDAGAEIYGAECRGCHSVSIGPTLRGVINRPAASVASFGGYSDALKAKTGLVWTPANIDAFITAPQTFAPGTLMTKAIADAQRRADIIAYLATLPPPKQ